jgi:hypothetical protein
MKMKKICLQILAFAYVFSCVLTTVEGSWAEKDLDYRKKITLASAAGASTNYVVKLNIGESAGSVGANFHIAGHGQADFDDIRFYDDDDATKLSYWIQDTVGASPNQTATIWVKVIDDLSSNRDIYIYYGDRSFESASDGKNTFVFFDDFNRANIADITTEAAYSKFNSATWSIENNMLKNVGGAGDPNKLIIDDLGSIAYDVEMLVRMNVDVWSVNNDKGRMGLSCCMVSATGEGYCALFHADQNSLDLLNDKLAWGTLGAYVWATDTWYHMKFRVIAPASNSGQVKVWQVGAAEPGAWTLNNTFGGAARGYGKVGVGGSNQADTTLFDNLVVRRVISPEPAFSSITGEENAPNFSASINGVMLNGVTFK